MLYNRLIGDKIYLVNYEGNPVSVKVGSDESVPSYLSVNPSVQGGYIRESQLPSGVVAGENLAVVTIADLNFTYNIYTVVGSNYGSDWVFSPIPGSYE